jgi:microcystin-dependent protein
MTEPFVGEIKMVGFNFAPRGYALCNGQLMSIAQNTALFSLLGTTYGGDGQVTFGLPDFRGRVPMHWGSGPGLTPRVQGESSGSEAITLTQQQMPQHNHQVNATNDSAGSKTPLGNIPAFASGSTYVGTAANGTMAPAMIGIAGGSQPHPNMQPYLVVTFIIALEGIFPSRN